MSASPGELTIIWKRWLAFTQYKLKGKMGAEVSEGSIIKYSGITSVTLICKQNKFHDVILQLENALC